MKKAIGLGLLIAVLFAAFVMFKDYVGASAFYIAAVAMAMFAVIGPFGNYLQTAVSMLIGLVAAMVGIIVLALKMPLPPDNLVYLALVCGLSLFVMVLLSPLGCRLDAMFLGWAGYYAAVYGTYTSDPTALASMLLPSAVGVGVSLLVGLVMSLLVIKIAMAVNH
jgi:hypothetical protein